MSTVALHKLLDYILSLTLTNENKDWLVDKIIEPKTMPQANVLSANSSPKHRCKYSDAELEQMFANRPNLDESMLSDVSKEDFIAMSRHHAHRPNKSIAKWL